MKPEVSIEDDLELEAEAQADAESIADIEAGRFVTGEAVKRWLRSWGSTERLPTPQIGE